MNAGFGRDFEYVMWLDADLIFADMDFRIEDILNIYPTAHLIASAGTQSTINSGSLIVKNSKWARQFLQKWWSSDHQTESVHSRFDTVFWQEKEALERRSGFLESKIAVLQPFEMNSVAPVWINHSPASPIIHLHGEISKTPN